MKNCFLVLGQIIALLLGSFFVTSANSYNINPINRINFFFYTDKFDYILGKIREPVHEYITLLALDCHPNSINCKGYELDIRRIRTSSITAPLVDGVEWNDDPSRMLLTNFRAATKWVYWMDHAKKIAKCEETEGGKCIIINETYDLLYRTHYGDLQFLHAMASSNGEHPTVTLQKMMDWAEFTYKVSTGEIRATDKLDRLEATGKSYINNYIKRGSWSVGYLFTKQEKISNNKVKLIALGSLLHMIQDSFSDSHVERVNSCNPLNHNKTDIQKFHNYSNQVATDHERADTTPDWLRNGDLNDSNPVRASADIIHASFNGYDWRSVELLLKNEILTLGENAQISDGGRSDCY